MPQSLHDTKERHRTEKMQGDDSTHSKTEEGTMKPVTVLGSTAAALTSSSPFDDDDTHVRSASEVPQWITRGSTRNKKRSDVPDLLLEDVDEEIERFMTLDPKGRGVGAKDGWDDSCSGLSMTKRRSESVRGGRKRDVMQWVCDNLGADVDSRIREEERTIRQKWENYYEDQEQEQSSFRRLSPLKLERCPTLGRFHCVVSQLTE